MRRYTKPRAWTKESDAVIKMMADKGNTANEVADFFGDVTRSAVLGRSRRIGVKFRNKKSENKTKENRGRKDRYINIRPVYPIEPIAQKGRSCIKPIDANDSHCRYPIGDPRDPNFSYCGDKVTIFPPYCEQHYKLCHNI